ncbi:MAG: DUF423 domain-containing protein [Flavobacteriales bacterium]|nr:DUF423 domain-containing protein [Flavobacteriales bacterium]
MKNRILALAAFCAFIAVTTGALGAHALKDHLSSESLKSFETASRYLMYHALYLLFLSVMLNDVNRKKIKKLLYLTGIGIVLFSGSIFLLSTINITKMEVFKVLGPITPLGGVLLIANWGLLFYYALRLKMFKE